MSTTKMEIARKIANEMLLDATPYCDSCGTFNDGTFPCCENKLIGTHMDFVKKQIEQNKDSKINMINDFGATADKTMRWGVSAPAFFYTELEKLVLQRCDEPLISKGKKGVADFRQFMKTFPEFTVCNRV